MPSETDKPRHREANENGGMHVETGGLEVVDRLADEWRTLLQKVSDDDPYSRPEWILANLRAYSPNARIVVLTLRRGRDLSLVFPLILEKGIFSGLPARKLRMPLAMPGARNEVLYAPELGEEAALGAVWKALESFPGWDVLELPSVYEKTPIVRLVQLAHSQGCQTGQWPVPRIPWLTLAGCDLAKLPPSSTLRSRLRHAEGRLNELGNLTLQSFEKADAAVLRRFFDLEAGGWKGKEKSAILSDPRSLQFFDEAAREAQKFGYLRLYYLELKGKLISAHFGLNYKGRYYAPKIAYDEAYRQYRVGHLILRGIVRDCAQQEIAEYSMGVLEEWKTEWSKESRLRTFQCIFNKGVWGRLLFAARFQIKPGLKKLMRRPEPARMAF
jgi:CelD/BcsL family acetyltransferase involved in cellulose biosynthesis